MRKNGSVDGIIELPGITDIGVEIEKLTNDGKSPTKIKEHQLRQIH